MTSAFSLLQSKEMTFKERNSLQSKPFRFQCILIPGCLLLPFTLLSALAPRLNVYSMVRCLKVTEGKKYKKVTFKVLKYSVIRMSDIVYFFFWENWTSLLIHQNLCSSEVFSALSVRGHKIIICL